MANSHKLNKKVVENARVHVREKQSPGSVQYLAGAVDCSRGSSPFAREQPRSSRRQRIGLRKRFLSLTEGISSFFANEKKDSGIFRRGSKESLRSLRQPSTDRLLPFRKDLLNSSFNSEDIGLTAYPTTTHGGSLSSFKNHFQDDRFDSPYTIRTKKGPSPPVDRLKKAPPSPPPRRYSFLLNECPKSISDPLAEAVISSSFGELPPYLKPPPPPPPIRVCQVSSHTPGSFTSRKLNKKSSVSNRHILSPNSNLQIKCCRRKPQFPALMGLGSKSKVENERNILSLEKSLIHSLHSDERSSTNHLNRCSAWSVGGVVEKVVSIVLQKENGTFGFTIRGGTPAENGSRTLIVTYVRPNGPAAREGTLHPGDRLVSVDGRDLTRVSLLEAQLTLQEVKLMATLGIRYDVSVMDSVRSGGGPLLVEIERIPGTTLGLTLTDCQSYSTNSRAFVTNSVFIESIKRASIAERCGALAVGDVVCAVDGLILSRFDHLTEANLILKAGLHSKVSLEIIPNIRIMQSSYKAGSPVLSIPSPCGPRCSLHSSTLTKGTLNRRGNANFLSQGQNGARINHQETLQGQNGARVSYQETLQGQNGACVSHKETLQATLVTEGHNFGMTLQPSPDFTFPTVAAIHPGGAVDRCGVICVGDRILGVNGRGVRGLDVAAISEMMTNTRPTVILDVEFDVTDVETSSETVFLNLIKEGGSLGIKITKDKYSKLLEPESLVISYVAKGSSAHRSGALEVGDKILSINDITVHSLTLLDAKRILEEKAYVTLSVQKRQLCSDLNTESSQNVSFIIQLRKDNGAIGIIAKRLEGSSDHIYVGGVVPGSVAAQTDAIHVGDRILEINGISIKGQTISEISRLLRGPENLISFKVSRPKYPKTNDEKQENLTGFPAAPTLSGDSAVESWESGGRLDQSNSKPSTLLDNNHRNDSMTSSDSGQSEDKTDWDKMIADLNQISAECRLRGSQSGDEADPSIANATLGSTMENSYSNCEALQIFEANRGSKFQRNGFLSRARTVSPKIPDEGMYSVPKAEANHRIPISSVESSNSVGQIFTLTLLKDPFYEDYGFSLSDGLYEKGIYINRIRKGGPAYMSGLLKPYDRILQVNDTPTELFDCCLTVPMIAASEEKLFLKVSRSTHSAF